MQCDICAIGCEVFEGGQGICGKYTLQAGHMVEIYPDRYLMICPISIETMPMLHFYPGGRFLQISTTGCNLDCPGCVSTVLVKEMSHNSAAMQHMSPEQIVAEAVANNCLGIAFLMNDPLASFHTFLRVAKCAREHHLLVGCSSNGYFSEASLEQIVPYLDFINIGLKGFDDASYRRCGAPLIQPVLENLRKLHERGVHIEVSCMSDKNNKQALLNLAHYLADISGDLPLLIMRYIPLEQASPDLEISIRESEEVQKEIQGILKYVYLFNSPGCDGLNSLCPSCKTMLYQRDFYGPMGAKLRTRPDELLESNVCPVCSCSINFRGTSRREAYQEKAFQGGYPFTRALEMLEAMLLAMGMHDRRQVSVVWEDILVNQRLEELHHDIQRLPSYLDTLLHCGEIAGCQEQARELANYIRSRMEIVKEVKNESGFGSRPRVYYAMGKPLFCIKGERMENQLVEAAGGHSVNRELEIDGRPGARISAEQLMALNPEVIFISAFISSSVDNFITACREDDIDVEALRTGRIYCHPAAGWDFGSPRWILGLMHISNMLFPNSNRFDIMAEAKEFYHRFYDLEFDPVSINRSFGKPHIQWQWQQSADLITGNK